MKREQGNARKVVFLGSAFEKGPPSGGFWRQKIFFFFFAAFSFVSKKNLQSLPLGGDCAVISDGHARRRLSLEKKTSLFYISYSHKFSRA